MARQSDLDKVGSHWDDRSKGRAHDSLQGWLDSPIVLEHYVHPRISGAPKLDWLTGTVERLRIPPGGRWLSIGCGSASTEIHAARSGFFSSMTALDVSSGSLEGARDAARRARVDTIEFHVADLDNLHLPPKHYDIVLAIMSLHHVRKLGPLLEQIEATLKPRGFLLTNEYIGPRRLQFTDRQLSIARELLEALPEGWRRHRETGSIKSEVARLAIRDWQTIDPSEAVRSDRIVEEIAKRFRIVERHDYGGTILHPMLEGIVHNFDPNDSKDVGAVRLLAAFESILIRLGAIPSDFTLIVARKRRWQGRGSTAWAILGRPATGEEIEETAGPLPPPYARSYIDFRRAAHITEIVSGFHQWESDSRWLGGYGEVRLRVAGGRLGLMLGVHSDAKGSLLPDGRPLTLQVALQPEGERNTIEVGSLVLNRTGLQEYTISLAEDLASRIFNQEVRVILRFDRTWIPAEVIPGSQDRRQLTVQVFRIAFES